MNDTRDSRLRIRFVLITIILATLPCYCTGWGLVRISGARRMEQRPTSTPLWAQAATQTSAAVTALQPSFTPIYVTATPPTPGLPSWTPTVEPSPTQTPTPTLTNTVTPTVQSFPTDTQPPPTETLPPTVTDTPTEPPASDTLTPQVTP